MWILDWLPSWIFTLITLIGIGGFLVTEFLNNLPFVVTYLKPIRVGSIIALVVGIYMMGGAANQEKWEARVKELEAKVAVAEEQSKTANVELASAVKEKKEAVKQAQTVIQTRIVQVKEKLDAECKVSPEAIEILNKAAELPK